LDVPLRYYPQGDSLVPTGGRFGERVSSPPPAGDRVGRQRAIICVEKVV